MSQTLDDFATLIRSARHSAVHLEMRDEYAMDNEHAAFDAWRAGERLDPEDRRSWWRPWLDLVQEVTGRGVTMRRARIISEPASEYIRWLYDGTFTNVAAGEDIRWLQRPRATGLVLPETDFWLFDGKIVQFNVFDDESRWVRTDQTDDPKTALLCRTAFEAVWDRAIPHDRFAT